jgi:hypothetical protein
MRRTLTLPLIVLISALLAACGNSATPPAESAASVENTCAQPSALKEGETPSCSEGCKWNGTECRQERSIIVHDRK